MPAKGWVLLVLSIAATAIFFWNQGPPDDRQALHDLDAQAKAYADELLALRRPVFGWRTTPEEVLELGNADSKQWSFNTAGKVRMRIEASSGVSFTVYTDEEDLRRQVIPSNGIAAPRLHPESSCMGEDVLKTEKVCELSAGDTFIVQDSRGRVEQATGILATVLGRNSSTIEAANAKNRVALKFDLWSCIRNCPTP